MPDIKFFNDGQGNVRQVPAGKIDKFKQHFPNASEATEEQLSQLESKIATQNKQAGTGINVSVPSVEKVDLSLSGNQNPFSRKGFEGAVEIARQHHEADPSIQFRAKYGAYKDNPELHRDEDAPEMVERRKKQPWYTYIGGGNAAVNAIKQNQYGEENQEDATKTRQSQEYLERVDKDNRHKESDKLSDFLTNTETGRAFVDYDDNVTKYFEELKPKVEKERLALQQQVNDVNERVKIHGRKARAANLIIQDEKKRQQDPSYNPTWDRKLDVERAQQEYKENYEALVALPGPNDIAKAQEALTSLKNMKEAVNDRDKSAVEQYLGEIKRNVSSEMFNTLTFGTKGMIEDATGVKGGHLTDKVMETTQMFAYINENLMKDQRSIAQDIAAGSMQTTGFILQMALTSGLAKGIVGAGGKVLSKLFTPTTREIARRVAFEGAGKVISVAGREVSEVFVQTFLMPSTLASALERNAENPGHFLDSWSSAYKSAFVEVGSERIGDFIPMGKFKSPAVNKIMKATHLNSIPVEWFEEQIGTAGHAVLGTGEGKWSDLTNKRNQLVTLGVVTASGMPYMAIESGGYAAGKYQAIKQKYEIGKSYKDNINDMQRLFGDESQEVISLIEASLESMNEDMAAFQTLVAAVANTEGLSEDQQNTILTFAMAATAKKGLEKAKAEQKAKAREDVSKNINENYVNQNTGSVVLGKVAGVETPVTIQGNVVFTAEGKIDTSKSGELYYIDSDGKTQVVDAHFVDLVDNTPAEQLHEELGTIAEEEVENEYADDATRPYEIGEEITYSAGGDLVGYGTITGITQDGKYIVTAEGAQPFTIEPRKIIPEDNLMGVANGVMVEYMNDNGDVVVGEVQDSSLRRQGVMIVDNQEIPTKNIIGVEGTMQAQQQEEAQAVIQEEAQQQAEETEVTPEQQAQQQEEHQKKEFYDTLPRKQRGKDKGELNHNQFTPEQKLKFVEFEYGKERAIAGAEVEVKNAEKRLKTAQTQLNNDPLNAAKIEAEIKAKEELDFYKSYVYEARRQQTEENKKASTSSIAEEVSKREQSRAEAKQQEQAQQAEIESLQGVPDVTVDKAKDARARGYRSVNGVRVDRQEAATPTNFTETDRKFSDKEVIPVKRTIVEAETLQPSHKSGVRNNAFFITEAQPKERTDSASKEAAESIARKINPDEITGGVTAYTGAPIVNSRGEVLQGNNRVRGLQLMYESSKESAEKYKQHLVENAADYGMTPEQVQAMNNPTAVDVADVSDAEAIRLGQLDAADTESGGIQRIAAKQTATALGQDIGRFSQILFESANEEAPISTVIELNGKRALDYLKQKGVINPTQFQSAFDNAGNVTPEAKSDLQNIASQMLFENASNNIERMFDALPDKAQKAILQTIHRDANSPKTERVVKEIQNAIEAFYILRQNDKFLNAPNYKGASIAAHETRNQSSVFNSETNLPLQKYSSFAIELAILFKSDTQKALRQRFNNMYDNIQGVGSELFEKAEKLSAVEAIKKHFNNIDYVSNDKIQRTDVAGDSRTGKEGQQTGAGEAASGERAETGEQSTDSGAGADTDNKQRGESRPKPDVAVIRKAIEELSKKLNTPITIYNSLEEIPVDEHHKEKSKSKGWYNPKTGEVFINLFNAKSIEDAKQSIFHEVVAHKGLRDMLGEKKHAKLMEAVFDALPKEVQDKYLKKYNNNMYIAADEYIAYLAENEQYLTFQEQGQWQEIKQIIIDFIEKHLDIKLNEQNVNHVINGLLVESKKRLENLNKDAPINIVEISKQAAEKEKAKQKKQEGDNIRLFREAQEFRDGHTAPAMDYSTLKEAIDEGGDFTLSEIITGKQEIVPDDFFDTRIGTLKDGTRGYMGAIRYGFNTKSGTESFGAIKALQDKIKDGARPTELTAKVYRAIPNKVNVNELIDGDWVTLSKDYAEKHGLARFGKGEYKIIEQDVPVNKLWWDGNDINELGYDVEDNIRYRKNEQTSTPEFKAWFGDSKVVDAEGKPLVVSHSTDANFTEFKNKQENDAGWLGDGYYFFGDRSLDGQYGKNVIQAYLSIENPYFISEAEYNNLVEANNKEVSKEFTRNLIGEGYDGVYYNGNLNQEWVAFYPNQIKSATGNVGAFDGSNADIRYRTNDYSQFKNPLNKVMEGINNHMTLKENDSKNAIPNIKETILYGNIKDYGKYGRYEIVPVNNPILNIHNLNRSIYGLGVELGYLNRLHNRGLLDFVGDTGYLDAENVKEFSKQFEFAIAPYERAILKAKHFATEAAQRELMDIIKDIDHARDYYERLSKDHDVLRSENEPRFRSANGSQFRFEANNYESELEAEKKKYNGNNFEVKGGNVLTTLYNVFESSDVHIELHHQGIDVSEIKSEAENVQNLAESVNTQIIVDANDLSIPIESIREHFGVEKEDGMSNVEVANDFLEDYIKEIADVEDYFIGDSSRSFEMFYAVEENEGINDLIYQTIDQLKTDTGVNIRKYSSFYITEDGKITNDDATNGVENTPITMRIADHTHNPSNGLNNINVVISNSDPTARRFRGAETDLEFDDSATAKEIADGIQEYIRDNSIRLREQPLFRRAKDLTDAEQAQVEATKKLRQEVDKVSWKFKTRFKEAWIDSFAQVKVLQDALKKAGLNIAEHNDYYLQATHIPGKVDARIEDYTNRYQKPLSKATHDMQNKGVSHRSIENYVMLHEGLVRNERMRNEAIEKFQQSNPSDEAIATFMENLPDDYSGLKAIEEEVGMSAQEFIDKIEEKAGKEVISNLWKRINAATNYSLQKQYEAGFITKETYDKLRENDRYVPLRGHDDLTAEDVYNYPSSMGVYFENPMKRADGRVSRAESPFAYIGQMAHSSIIQGVKNQHNQMLLRLSRQDKSGLITNSRSWEVNMGTVENPMWMIDSAPFDSDIDTYIQNQIDFEERMQELQELGMARQSGSRRVDVGGLFIKPRQAEQHEITVFENGVRHTLYINANPAIARAINQTNKWHVGETWGVIEQVLKVNRQMAANFTTRDVRFIFTNFARDTNMASTLILAEQGGKQMIDFNKNIKPAFGTVKRHFTGKADLNSKNDAYFREFLMNGGMTGYYQLYELNRQAKKLEREANKGDKRNALDRGKSVINAVDIMNEVVENTTRFAAYMTSREAGKSVVQSVHAAKNVSVNFNQKGAGTSVSKNAFQKALFSAAGAVIPSFLFSNANIQGMYRIYQATKGNPLKMGAAFGAYTLAGLVAPRGTSYLSKGYIKAMEGAAGYAALAWIAPILAGLVGGDDGEEEYMKQGEWDRQNNFTLMLPSGSFLKYPISHEFRVWYKLGDHIYQMLTGKEDAVRAVTEMLYAMSDLVPADPLNALDASPAELTPDFARPFAQLSTNTNFMGSSIYNEWANPDAPGYLNAKTNKKGEPIAPEILVEFLKSIDHVTGGDGAVKGWASPNPDITHHFMRGFAGGLYTNIMQGISFGFEIYNAVNGEGFNLKAKDTPARAFYTSKDDLRFDSGAVNREYYDISRNASKTIGRANRYKKQYLEADINLTEYIEKIRKLDLTTANEQYEYIKGIKEMEKQLPELQGKEQKDKELEIYQKKKELVEMVK